MTWRSWSDSKRNARRSSKASRKPHEIIAPNLALVGVGDRAARGQLASAPAGQRVGGNNRAAGAGGQPFQRVPASRKGSFRGTACDRLEDSDPNNPANGESARPGLGLDES